MANKISGYFILAIIIIFTSCKRDNVASDNTIHIRLRKEIERLNPLISPNPIAREVYQYIHLPLADFDPESLALTPILIKEIPQEMPIDTGIYKGGISFDIEILEEAKWDNGSPITGEDYLFTIKAINLPLSNGAKYRAFAENIKEVKVDPSNPKKFRVIFSQDYLLALESAVNIEIYPRYFYDSTDVLSQYALSDFTEANEDKVKADSTLVKFAEIFNGNDFSRNKISGSGPYKFVSWAADQNIVLEKKENYWASGLTNAALAQGPDKMIFSIIPDEVTAITQLKAGTLDVINEISGDAYKTLSEDPIDKDKYNFYHPTLIKQYVLLVNNLDTKLNDKNVRRALAHLIDIDNIISNLENGMGRRTVGPIHPIKKTFNSDLVPVKYDIAQAQKLLSEAGWNDSNNNGILDKKINGKTTEMDIEILITGNELGKKIALMMQESATKVGIKLNITSKDFKQIKSENLKTRKYQLITSVISQDIIQWDDMETRWHSKNDNQDGDNEASYSNPKTDALIDQILSTKTDAERIEIYKKIQAQIYEDQPCIFLYAPEEKIVVSKKWNSSSTAKRPGYLANTFSLLGSSKLTNK